MKARREALRRTGAVRRHKLVRSNRFRGRIKAQAVPTSGDGGQAMVEFALVASLLLLLLFGIVDFSRVFFSYATMAHGVREAARWGIIHPEDEAGIISLAESSMVVLGGEPVVEVGYPGSPDHAGPYCSYYCTVVVTGTVTLDVWTPVLPSINIETYATMHIE